MATLVVGATGATGQLVVAQLLEYGRTVKAIVRSPDGLPRSTREHSNLVLIQASILELSEPELAEHLKDCDSVVSCLGHRLSFSGIFGRPRRLVTDAVRRLCDAIRTNATGVPVKFVLMNTTGNRNRDLDESVSFAQRCVILLLRLMVPPHADNEDAAEFLRTEIGKNDNAFEWVAVRPDGLTNEDIVTAYEIHVSPTRSAIFNAGKTSRINVAHFMAALISNPQMWDRWKGQMPVIYNENS